MDDLGAPQQALHHAFDEFTRSSRTLEASYRELEVQVAELSARLERADRELEARVAEEHRLARRFERLLCALPGGVVVLDADGRVQDCNPAAERLLGGPLTGAPWREIVAVAFAPEPDDGHDITVRSGYRVNLSTCSLPEEPGQILLLADVTETRRLQARTARLERLGSLGRTVAGIAHQIRTPLASALLYASTLPESSGRDRILTQLRGLERLVEDMLTYARQGELAVEPLDLVALLERLAERQLESAGGRLVLDARVPSGAAWVQGNRDALASAVQNLVDNAWDADPQAEVRLSLHTLEDGELELRCADDGPGIPKELCARVLDPFFTTREGGTGLGLAIVRAIVEAHAGTVAVESADAGTTVALRLPTLDPGQHAEPGCAPAAADALGAG